MWWAGAAVSPGSMDRRRASLRGQIPDLFRTLPEFRVRLEPAVSFTTGALEDDGLHTYFIKKAAEPNRAIPPYFGISEGRFADMIIRTGVGSTARTA